MTWRKILSVAALAMVAGCASSEEVPEPLEPIGESDSDEIHWAGAWRYHSALFDCDNATMVSSVRWNSRRHVYSFPGTPDGVARFTLDAEWPDELGALLFVTDALGAIVGAGVSETSAGATALAHFQYDEPHYVFVSPLWHWKVSGQHSYVLSAQCEAALCAEFVTSDGRYYAKNFPPGAEAEAKKWALGDPQVFESGVNQGTCVELNAKVCPADDSPVCGEPIETGLESTYASLCEFQKVVRKAAGASGESKGRFTPGACSAQPLCATAVVSPPYTSSPVVYAKNFSSPKDAWLWLDDNFLPDSQKQVTEGACDEPPQCTSSYQPVCGGVMDAEPKTYSNSCIFEAAVMAAAGDDGESKGWYEAGECAPVCDYAAEGKSWVAKDPAVCAAIKFSCASGALPFFDACGCGCQLLTK